MNPAHVLPDHDIAVVIVNYNSAEMSLNAMQSIFDKTADTNSIHIHVVDNASPDDCATVLRKEISGRGWASQTTLYEETTNHGFGRGNNVALNAIAAMDQKPEKVMFLNPDACLQSDVITNLSKRLDQQPDVAIAGSAIRDEHGEVAVAAFRFPNILGVFADAVNFGPISGLFANWRYVDLATREENPEFVLNQPAFRSATILVAGDNFGCGSSREHAAWALKDYGIRVIAAPSFGSIFYSNCIRNGILPIRLSADAVNDIASQIESSPGVELSVDLVEQRLTTPSGLSLPFEIGPSDKEMLLEGLDGIAVTEKRDAEILSFIERDQRQRPWAYL